MVTLRELIADTVRVHGFGFAAKHWRKRVPFALFYWAAFGRAPRARRMPPVNAVQLLDNNCLRVAQVHVAASLLG